MTPDTGLEQTVTLNADMDALLPNGSGDVYKLLRMTISVDGGVEIDLTTGDVNTGEYTYTPIEPGHSYLFTAYYQPYVVIFHQNGTEEMVTQLYNQYDHSHVQMVVRNHHCRISCPPQDTASKVSHL